MKMKEQRIDVWHLEMLTPGTASDMSEAGSDLELRLVEHPMPELSRFLYVTVGAPWTWYMRLNWSYQQWSDYLDNPAVTTWIAFRSATPIGYFELERQGNDTVEIVHLGLVPSFIGKGLGKALLQHAIDQAWRLGGKRIWLHTCSLDHPGALANYIARGFSVFKEESLLDQIPAERIQPWENAGRS